MYKDSKEEIRLNYIEFQVVDRCNLNCNACSHFAPMVRHDFDHLPSFKNDIKQLRELFKDIRVIRLLGGEPFVENRLDEFISITRELYPHSRIEVVTNGLLIPAASKRVLQSISDNEVVVNVTMYPPTEIIKQNIRDILNDYGIKYVFSGPVSTFHKKFTPDGKNDAKKAFADCTVGRQSTFIYMGRLYLCSGAALVKYYNECAGTDIVCRDSFVDLYNTSAEKIIGFLQRHNESCRYCGKISEEPWSRCCDLDNVDTERWVTTAGTYD